jgi:hypothetical protein
MKKTDSLFKQLHEEKEKTKKLKMQLDEWIDNCQLQADLFFERKMEVSEASSLAMKIAYTNVKNLL